METSLKPRVLVVDDEMSICRACEKILSRRGYEVRTVLSGKQALALLEQEPFDLVFTDLRLATRSGVDVLAWSFSRHCARVFRTWCRS